VVPASCSPRAWWSLALAVFLATGDTSADLIPLGKKLVPHALRVEGLADHDTYWFLVFDCAQPDVLDYCVLTDPAGDYNVGSGAGLFALPRSLVKTKPAWRLLPDGGLEPALDAGVAVVSPDIGALSGEPFFRKGHPRMVGPFSLARYPYYGAGGDRVRRVVDVLRIEGVRGKQIDARYVRVAFVCSDGQQRELPWDGQGDRPPQPCGEDPPPPPEMPSVAPAPSASAEVTYATPPAEPDRRWLWGVAFAMMAAGLAALASGLRRR
jgi:hypothetical protein